MDKTTKNKMDKKKCNNSPIPKQHRKSNKKPKNRSYIMTILDNAETFDINLNNSKIRYFHDEELKKIARKEKDYGVH